MSESQGIELPKRKRDPSEGELDITPMIDIVFLLLSFFVVVSNMDPQATVPLPSAGYGESISEKKAVTLIVVMKDGTEEHIIYKGRGMDDGSIVPPGDPQSQEEEIGRFVEEDFSRDPGKEWIVLKASGDVKTRVVEMVKRGIAKSDLAKEKKLYVGIKEEDR